MARNLVSIYNNHNNMYVDKCLDYFFIRIVSAHDSDTSVIGLRSLVIDYLVAKS